MLQQGEIGDCAEPYMVLKENEAGKVRKTTMKSVWIKTCVQRETGKEQIFWNGTEPKEQWGESESISP